MRKKRKNKKKPKMYFDTSKKCWAVSAQNITEYFSHEDNEHGKKNAEFCMKIWQDRIEQEGLHLPTIYKQEKVANIFTKCYTKIKTNLLKRIIKMKKMFSLFCLLMITSNTYVIAGDFNYDFPSNRNLYGNVSDVSELGNKRKGRYEPRKTDESEDRQYRTGLDINYHYIPQRPGTENCERVNTNYVRCN